MEEENQNPDMSKAIIPLLLSLLSQLHPSHLLLLSLLLFLLFLYNFTEFHVLEDALKAFRGDRVGLTFHHDSEIYQKVASKCRTLHGRYLTTPWLASPHVQTVFLNFFGNPPAVRYRRQIFQFHDGGKIALDWLLPSDVTESSFQWKSISKDDATPIVVVVPGLSSDSSSPYMKHLVHKLSKRGWNVVVSNHRGLGGISITSDCFYNAGWTEDTRVVIKHLHREYPKAPLFAVGTSLGSNILVKYLGEEGENTPIAGAVSVCSPWDLLICDRFINRKLVQNFYDKALVFALKSYAELHQRTLSRMVNWEGLKKARSIREFDNHATRHLANYETVDTFYRRCSSVGYVADVTVPMLCISSLDDPLCTREAIPWDECRANKNIVLATTKRGGHLAFFKGLTARSLWWVGAVEEFLSILESSQLMHNQKQVPVTDAHASAESAIDKTPYINVTEDGMVEMMVHEMPNVNSQENLATTLAAEDQEPESTQENASRIKKEPQETEVVADGHPELREQNITNTKNNVADFGKLVEPVKKSLDQLSQKKNTSIWLLAYVAIVTTWPLLGSALHIVFKRKKRDAASPSVSRR